MRKLASNDVALLVKCGREYWIVRRCDPSLMYPNGWDTIALDEKSEHYGVNDALAYFYECFGAPTWTRDNISNY